jgi:hypothetical protein
MPRRTKRRLIAAGVAASVIIGAGIAYGISGNAAARGSRGSAGPVCIPEEVQTPPETSSAAPEAPAPPEETAPPEEAPPENTSTEQAPPAEAPAAEAPAEEKPAEEKPAEQPDQNQGDNNQGTAPAAAVAKQPGDEAGAQPPATPDAQPQAQMRGFAAPNCSAEFGPDADDFVDIRKVRRTANLEPRVQRGGSRGTFVSRCGTNENNHQNPDNFIVAPGVRNGAHHTHDYVGNLTADANSTNESLQASGTTCRNGDKSTYYWPVMRARDANGLGAGDPENLHNIGTILKPRSAVLQFRGNAKAKVVAMPDFLRVITGDAKATINGGANGNAKWTCTGFTGKFSTKYTICPQGSRLQRVLDFASCWDGKNFDSANHRDHIKFPGRDGACPAGTKAVPALRMTLTYDIPRGRVFAVDAFPEVRHAPETDHGDFVNVFPKNLMDRMVRCINNGQNC